MKKLLFTLLALLAIVTVHAQGYAYTIVNNNQSFHLIKVDLASGTETTVGTLPASFQEANEYYFSGVTTYDYNHNRLIVAIDSLGTFKVKAINVEDATIAYTYTLPNPGIFAIEYDSSNDLLYALGWDNQNVLELRSIDFASGTDSQVGSITAFPYFMPESSTYDVDNQRFIVQLTNNINSYILGISATNASVVNLHTPNFSDNNTTQHLEYDAFTGFVYASYWNGQNYIFNVYDLALNIESQVAILPSDSLGTQFGTTCFDINNNWFLAAGQDADHINTIYAIDAANGTILHQYNPIGAMPWPSVGLCIENSTVNVGIAKQAWFTPINAFPNPLTTHTTIQFENAGHQQVILSLIDVTGKELRRVQTTSNQVTLNRGQLPAGNYFLRLMQNNELLGAGKLVVE